MVTRVISSLKMTMWADNVKFVKDILDSKYQKIDSAVLEVIFFPRQIHIKDGRESSQTQYVKDNFLEGKQK